jgi:hypothetical protein
MPVKHVKYVLIGALLGAAVGCNGGEPEASRTIGPQIIALRLAEPFGALQRPAVEFDHEKHTQALQRQGCTACHLDAGGGKLSLKLGRTEDGDDRDALINIYHERCIGCHTQRKQDKQTSGPFTCGECHVRRSTPVSSRRPASFSYGLHDAHIKATDKKCATCHTLYDETKKRFVYREGVAGGCGDFFGADTAAVRLALRSAAHKTCITCHMKSKSSGKKSGPITCRGCHGGKAYKAAQKPGAIQQLVSNQPETTWIQTAGATSKLVPFNHRIHEPLTPFCSTCHHQTLLACKDCHTLTGSSKGRGVTMATAYHHASSKHSCVGCHKQVMDTKDCSGCHARQGRLLSKRSCSICHSGPQPKAGASSMPAVPTGEAQLAALPPASDNFPDRVVIKGLADKYGPSELPHRKIVARLDAGTRGSKLASRFHEKIEVLCAGCHHRSPVGTRPPPCKACHGKAAHRTKDQPGLKTAYHRQCIGCHQRMAIKQGCTDCHKKTSKEVGQ